MRITDVWDAPARILCRTPRPLFSYLFHNTNMTFTDIVLEYICPSLGCFMASVMFAGEFRLPVRWDISLESRAHQHNHLTAIF